MLGVFYYHNSKDLIMKYPYYFLNLTIVTFPI